MQCPNCKSVRIEAATKHTPWVCTDCMQEWGDPDDMCRCNSGKVYKDCHLASDIEEFIRQSRKIIFSTMGYVKQTVRMRQEFIHVTSEELVHRLNTGEYQTSIQETIGTIYITATGETIADVIQIDNNLEYVEFYFLGKVDKLCPKK